ncbi:MAG: XrtA/PEP-CTERM system histidine kinase PrsK [Thermodesulfovibrionales bacterium]
MVATALSLISLVLTAGFSLYTLKEKNRSLNGGILSALFFLTASLELFDLLAVRHPEALLFWKRYSLMAEALLPPLWLLFSLTYARKGGERRMRGVQQALFALSPLFLLAATFLPVQSFFHSPDFAAERILFLGNTGFFFYIGILCYMIVSLVNLEMTLFTATKSARWKIKFEILGTGLLAALAVFYYSQVLLYRSLNMSLLPVRSVVAITAVLCMVYARAKRSGSVKVSVSRQVAYRSVVVFAVGLYLLGLGLVGEGMRYFGPSTRKVMVASLAFLGGMGLLLLFLSERVRRRIEVLLHKNFYTNKYDYRMQWIQFTDRLSSSKTGEELLKAVLSGFCETFGTEGAALFQYDEEKKAYFNTVVFEMRPIEAALTDGDPLVQFLKGSRRIFNAKDGGAAQGAADRDLLARSRISFVVPLHADRALEGFIAMGKLLNKKEEYTYEDYDLMRTFARHASSVILNLRLSEKLSNAREMEALGKISAFVVHDLKNLVFTLSLMVDNAKEYMNNPDFQQDMLQSLDVTIGKMKRLITKLRNFEEKEALNRKASDLQMIAYETASMVNTGEVRVDARPVVAEVDVEEIQKVLLNLILNAFDATGGNGPVQVEVGESDGAFIRVRDKGCGMTEEFQRKHLFKPFSTTKEKGLGIGLYQCRQIVEAHGGRIEVSSAPGKGSVFTVALPSFRGAGCAVQEG